MNTIYFQMFLSPSLLLYLHVCLSIVVQISKHLCLCVTFTSQFQAVANQSAPLVAIAENVIQLTDNVTQLENLVGEEVCSRNLSIPSTLMALSYSLSIQRD